MNERATEARDAGNEARMRAAGMYGLLSEILGSGALHQRYGEDHDLIDRVKMACADQERAMQPSSRPIAIAGTAGAVDATEEQLVRLSDARAASQVAGSIELATHVSSNEQRRVGTAVPVGHALVPLRLTREMDEVIAEEGWEWQDLLAAAGSITLEQYDKVASGAGAPRPRALSTSQLDAGLKAWNDCHRGTSQHQKLQWAIDAALATRAREQSTENQELLKRQAEVEKLAEKIRVNAEGALAHITNLDRVYNSIEMIAEDALRILGVEMDFDKPVSTDAAGTDVQKP